MKKSVNAWCFPKEFTAKECFETAKDAGFDWMEINMADEGEKPCEGPTLRFDSTDEEVYEILKLSEAANVGISGVSTALLWEYPLTCGAEKVRNKGMAIVERMIDAAAILGTDSVLVVPGVVNETVSYKTAYERALEALKTLKEKAEEKKVVIGVENVWNRFLLSPLEMRRFIEETDSTFVKAYFDVGNALPFSRPEDWIEILSDLVFRVHLKDFDLSIGNERGFKNLFEGDVNWKGVVESLRKSGYEGFLTAELQLYRTRPELLAYDASRRIDTVLSM